MKSSFLPSSFLKKLPRTALLAAMLAFSGEAAAAFKVVGYFPTWQGDVNTIPYSKVTHINYSFVLPTNTGGLMPLDGGGTRLQTLVSKAHASGVKVLIAVGGWNNGDDSAFRSLSANSTYRTAFVNNLVNFVNQYNLDGVDIDWEYPDAGTEATNFLKLMQQLSSAMHSRGKLLTAAVTANDFPGSVNADVINAVDFLNLMAYDLGTPHSTYQHAQNALTHWTYEEGLPKSKAVLGVPFYSHTNWVAYKDVIARYGTSASQVDNAGGLDYNGQPTIRAKAELAKAQAGGIMFWELSQDTTNGTSLLSTIAEVVGNTGGGTTPPPTERFAIPGTIEAEKYKGFYDTTAGNSGNAYRTDNVDIESSTQNSYNIGWIAAGEWLEYPITTSTAGQYKVDALVASQSSGGKFRLMIDGQSLGQVTVPVTGGWQNWQWVSTQVTLPAGQKTLRVSMDTAGFNLNALKFTQVSSGGGGTSTPIAAGRYTIKAVHSGKCLDVAASSTADGANVQQYSCNNTGAQAFDLKFDSTGSYQIINANSKKYLDVASASTADGANVQQWASSGGNNQKFTIVDRGNGQYEIRAKHSGKCVDVSGISTADSANVHQWSCLGQTNQRWMFAHSNWSAGSTGGGDTTTTWKKANLTNYTSYPDPGSDECVNYNGCQWAGYFAFLNGKQPESWVKNNNIIAVHSKDATQYQLKTLRLRQGSKTIDAIVYDMCSDSDCDGCCTENSRETGFLIDVEKYTMQRFGSGDGIVEWTCLDCK